MNNSFSSNNKKELSRPVLVTAIHADTIRQMDWKPVYERMPMRMKRAERYHFERDRLLCIGAGILLLEIVGIKSESELQYGEYGRISAPNYPDFNLSHSGEWCILAMGEADIGIDIEKINRSNLRVSQMVFTPGELKWMEENPPERFHVLWTMKESIMKATGLGMNLPPSDFEVLPFCQNAPFTLFGRSWYAFSGKLDEYRYTVCASYPLHVDFNVFRYSPQA